MTSSITYDMYKARPKEVIFLLEAYDLTTDKAEIAKAKRLWQQGKSIHDIADSLRPTPRGLKETFLLLLHMADKGIIKERAGCMWGMER